MDFANPLSNAFVKKDGQECFVISVSFTKVVLSRKKTIQFFAAVCAENCIHGSCTFPGECVCHQGWFGPTCDQCMENPDCVHGRCVDSPFQCQCHDGYQGTYCEEPICSEGCHPELVRVENNV